MLMIPYPMSGFGNSGFSSGGGGQGFAKSGGGGFGNAGNSFGDSGNSTFGGKPSGFGAPSSGGNQGSGEPNGFGNKPSGFGNSNENSSFGNGGGNSKFGNGGGNSGFGNGGGNTGFGNGGGNTGFGNGGGNTGFGNGGGNSGFGNGGGNSGFGNGGGNSGFGNGGGNSGFDGSNSGDRACHNCKEVGHLSRDCPQKSNRVCYNCQQPGHDSRQCTEERRPRQHNGDNRSGGFRNSGGAGFGGNRGGNGGESDFGGNNGKSGFGGNNGGSGFGGNNGGSGFGSKSGGSGFGGNGGGSGFGGNGGGSGFGGKGGDSGFGGNGGGFGGNGGDSGFGGNRGDSGFGGGGAGGGFENEVETRGPMTCYNCRGEGHRSSECPQPPRGCFNCGQQGHNSKECTEPPKPRDDGGEEGKMRATFVPEEEEVESVFDSQKIQEGKMFQKFFDAEVTVSSGTEQIDVRPFRTFEEASLPDLILRNVKHAGYTKTTPIQQYSLPLIARGFDMLACAQTGSGKTAAFLLPIMNKLIQDNDLNTAGECGCFPRCIILAPTRELAVQIYNEGRKFAYQTMVEIKAVYGGLAVGYSRSQIERGASIIVGTVGRIKHFIDEKVISLEKLRYFVLDEADRMIDNMGFGDDITYITRMHGMPTKENRQTLMFSATFPDSIQTACRDYMKPQYAMVAIDKIGTANKCVTQDFFMCERSEKREKLLELLGVDVESYTSEKNNDVFTKKTIVFVSRRSFADSLAVTLTSSGIPTITIHGAREQAQRDQALRMFRNGSKPVLIATAVAERGLDIKGVDHVINYDMPDNIDNYIHRIGRTGRVGNAGRATSFVSSDDIGLFGDIKKMLTEAGQIVPSFMENGGGNEYGTSSFDAPAGEDSW